MAEVADNKSEISWYGDEATIEKVIKNDKDLQEIAAKFESDISIEANTELNIDPTDSLSRDSDSASNSSSLKDNEENAENSSDNSMKTKLSLNNGDVLNSRKDKSLPKEISLQSEMQAESDIRDSKINKEKDISKKKSDADSTKSKTSSTRRKNPLKLLKKLTKSDKPSKESSFRSEFSTVVVDTLPQVFVAKYLGHRDVAGVSGLHHIRKPVDDMVLLVKAQADAKKEIRLPFLYVIVSPKGIDLREHPSNKVKDGAPLGLMPIDFISYGVQDIKYWRVFICIVVRSLSRQTRSATCHAFLCDSPYNGRKMALSLGVAFNVYAQKLKTDGKIHNFQVELRPPDELTEEMAECDA